jgi:hypothetical protein
MMPASLRRAAVRVLPTGRIVLAAGLLGVLAALLFAGRAGATEIPPPAAETAPPVSAPEVAPPPVPKPVPTPEPAPNPKPGPEATPPVPAPPAPEAPAPVPPAIPEATPPATVPETPPAHAPAPEVPVPMRTSESKPSFQAPPQGGETALTQPRTPAPESPASPASEPAPDVVTVIEAGSQTDPANPAASASEGTKVAPGTAVGAFAAAGLNVRSARDLTCALPALERQPRPGCATASLGPPRLSETARSSSSGSSGYTAAIANGPSDNGPDGGSMASRPPVTPAPGPAPSGASGGTAAGGVGGLALAFLTLAGLLLVAPLRAMRRLRLSSPPWLTACFVLIPERPG